MQSRCRPTARAALPSTLFMVLVLLTNLGTAKAKEEGASNPLSLYQAALHALEANELQRFRASAARIETFPLYPYLRYAELRQRIESVTPAAVKSYLNRYSELPVTALLRAAWLRELARRQDWPTFLAVYQGSRDADLRCALVQAKLAMGDKEQAIREAKRLWSVGYRQPQNCNPAFDLLERAGVLTPQRVEHRILLALAAGHSRLATDLLARLPASERAKTAHWIEVYRDPEAALQHPPLGSDEVVSRLLTAALGDLARDDPTQAYRLWSKIKARHSWPQAVSGPIARIIALRAAYNGLPSAGAWLQALPAAQTDTLVHAWRVRSALRRGDWEGVARAVEEMAPEQRHAEVWRYWQARALEMRGQGESAEELYRTIAGEFSYYGFLAADALDTPYFWGRSMPSPDPRRKRELRQRSGVQRAVLLHQAEQHDLAQLEWRSLIERLGTRDRLAAARIAAEQSWPWATLYAAVMAGVNNASFLRFPRGYSEEVQRSARSSGIDPAWLFALIRRESAFRGSACSYAGACGLMQLMPATARWMLERSGKHSSNLTTVISDPGNNIAVGADYLAYLRGRFASHILALAAYNAGPGNVGEWLDMTGPPPGSARWIETLLFGETRRYLKAVVFNEVIYRLRLNDETLRVSQVLKAERKQYARVALEEPSSEQR
ncbi:MAG: transglycosylase SLT domain-containing protein [Nitrococcus sp.]|nr:transglycosylase SLT domain-containing protein [Nitrococcus sp.]